MTSDAFANVDVQSIAGDSFLFSAYGGSFTFVVSGSSFLFTDTDGINFASIIGGSRFLSPVVGVVGFVFAVLCSKPFSHITDDGFCSPTTDDPSLLVDLPALSLFGTRFCAHCPFLGCLSASLASFAMLIIEKRLFDKVFIKQRPLASIQ